MAARPLPSVELCDDPSAPPGEVAELSRVQHGLVSTSQVARLDRFTALRSLVLHGGPLAQLEGLQAVGGTLEELTLSANALESLAGLGHLPRLRALNVARTRGARARAQKGRTARPLGAPRGRGCGVFEAPAPSARSVALTRAAPGRAQASNRLRTLSGLDGVPSLERLVVSHNVLESLEGCAPASQPAGTGGPGSRHPGPPRRRPHACLAGC